jgi:EH domain-containing protein 1
MAFQDGDGRLTGSDALKFFAMSNLSRTELKQVGCQKKTEFMG